VDDIGLQLSTTHNARGHTHAAAHQGIEHTGGSRRPRSRRQRTSVGGGGVRARGVHRHPDTIILEKDSLRVAAGLDCDDAFNTVEWDVFPAMRHCMPESVVAYGAMDVGCRTAPEVGFPTGAESIMSRAKCVEWGPIVDHVNHAKQHCVSMPRF
jgi:hypothetical protein